MDVVESVVVHLVVTGSEVHANAELSSVDDISVNVGVERLHESNAGVLHVRDHVVCVPRRSNQFDASMTRIGRVD